MTLLTFPTLSGLAFPVKKIPTFQSIVHTSVSGTRTGQSQQPYATYAYELPFEFLRSDNVNAELQALMGFYQACRGRAIPFHFKDPDDFTVTGQALGTGDGATTDFALLRSLGTDTDPIQDVDSGGLIAYVNGVVTAVTQLTTARYGTVYGIRFAPAPANGTAITADFTYKFLCRFDEDRLPFEKFMYLDGVHGTFSAMSVKFSSEPQ